MTFAKLKIVNAFMYGQIIIVNLPVAFTANQ
jgi:hypothetical protein